MKFKITISAEAEEEDLRKEMHTKTPQETYMKAKAVYRRGLILLQAAGLKNIQFDFCKVKGEE